MDQLTTYTVKAKTADLVMMFKYHLNGDLEGFQILSGALSTKQIEWLFWTGHFPAVEGLMRSIWLAKLKDKFEVHRAAPILDFDNFWQMYNLKVKKDASEKAWNKLSEGDRVKCFLALKAYDKHLMKTGQAKAHLVTWINQKRFNDEY